MKNKILLLSYPRSGNTFFGFFLKEITQSPNIHNCVIKAHHNVGKKITNIQLNALIKNGYIFKEHHSDECKYVFNKKNDKLIFLIRNYKECIIRNIGTKRDIKNACIKYCNNINFFDSYKGDKVFLYYEDFIFDFKTNFDKVLPIIDYDKNQYINVFNNFKKNKNLILKKYNNTHGSLTKGKKAIFHSLQLNKNKKLLFDNIIKSKVYNKKYINRYFE